MLRAQDGGLSPYSRDERTAPSQDVSASPADAPHLFRCAANDRSCGWGAMVAIGHAWGMPNGAGPAEARRRPVIGPLLS